MAGSRLNVKQIPDLFAIRADIDLSGVGRAAVKARLPFSPKTWRALGQDGWILKSADPAAIGRALRDELPDGFHEVLPVYENSEDTSEAVLGTWRLTVRFRPGIPAGAGRRILEHLRFRGIRRRMWNRTVWSVQIPRSCGDPLAFAASAAKRLRDQAHVEPEMLHRIRGRGPAEYDQQWQLHGITTPYAYCTSNAHIRAESAWPLSEGDDVTIAVIDGAFQTDHPNLNPAILETSAYLPSTGTDQFGFTAAGPGLSTAPTWHGTACAGLAAARPDDDGLYLKGAAPKASLMLIRLDVYTSKDRMADAILYAANPSLVDPLGHAEEGAGVISVSLTMPPATDPEFDAIQDAIDYAVNYGRQCRGCPFFFAVSNSNVSVSNDATASNPNVIAVSKSNCQDTRNGCAGAYGPELDFVAPGCAVSTTRPPADYGSQNGTSMATPLAAGVAALVLGANPNLTACEVREVLRLSCDKIGGVNYVPAGPTGRHDDYGHGRINAKSAVVLARQMMSVGCP